MVLDGLRERKERERDFEESGERVNTDRLWGEKELYLISFFFCLFIDWYLEYQNWRSYFEIQACRTSFFNEGHIK